MANSKDDLLASANKASVMELNELVKVFEEEFGAPDGPASASVADENKSGFCVSLDTVGANKVAVIKAVRELAGIGLKEAKDLVDGVPRTVKEGMTQDEAEKLKKLLEDAGGQASIR